MHMSSRIQIRSVVISQIGAVPVLRASCSKSSNSLLTLRSRRDLLRLWQIGSVLLSLVIVGCSKSDPKTPARPVAGLELAPPPPPPAPEKIIVEEPVSTLKSDYHVAVARNGRLL